MNYMYNYPPGNQHLQREKDNTNLHLCNKKYLLLWSTFCLLLLCFATSCRSCHEPSIWSQKSTTPPITNQPWIRPYFRGGKKGYVREVGWLVMISYWEHFIVTHLFVNPSTPRALLLLHHHLRATRPRLPGKPGWIFFVQKRPMKHTNSSGQFITTQKDL